MQDFVKEYFLTKKKLRIGTRGSKLALLQANEVKNYILNSFKDYIKEEQIEIIKIETTGDIIKDRDIKDIGGKALFLKEIEEALLKKQIDLAVHSMKDVPAFIHPDLDVNTSFIKREDTRDIFISKKYKNINQLPNASVVGTSSPRRKAILLKMRPDLNIVSFRGNVTTRIDNVLNKNIVDATILAVAGLNRLDINTKQNNFSIISDKDMISAIGQGSLAIEIRNEDAILRKILYQFNHLETEIRIKAERKFMQTINGDCFTPIAAHCYIKESKLFIDAIIIDTDGKEFYEVNLSSDNISISGAEAIGKLAGEEIKINAKDLYNNLIHR